MPFTALIKQISFFAFNLFKTLKHTYISANEAQKVSTMTIKALQMLRCDFQFDPSWNHNAQKLEIPELLLPHKLRCLSRYEVENFQSDQAFYKRYYFESLDIIIACIKNRFHQLGFEILSKFLIKATKNEDLLKIRHYLQFFKRCGHSFFEVPAIISFSRATTNYRFKRLYIKSHKKNFHKLFSFTN